MKTWIFWKACSSRGHWGYRYIYKYKYITLYNQQYDIWLVVIHHGNPNIIDTSLEKIFKSPWKGSDDHAQTWAYNPSLTMVSGCIWTSPSPAQQIGKAKANFDGRFNWFWDVLSWGPYSKNLPKCLRSIHTWRFPKIGEFPQSSILCSDFPWNKPSSELGVPPVLVFR